MHFPPLLLGCWLLVVGVAPAAISLSSKAVAMIITPNRETISSDHTQHPFLLLAVAVVVMLFVAYGVVCVSSVILVWYGLAEAIVGGSERERAREKQQQKQ